MSDRRQTLLVCLDAIWLKANAIRIAKHDQKNQTLRRRDYGAGRASHGTGAIMKDNLTGFYQAAEAEYEIRCDDFFKDWVPNNQSVIDGFLQVANKIRNDFGLEHYGAQAAYEILRYHTMERDNSSDFKLNNNNVAMLSRYVMAKYPQLDGFFSLRTISGLPEEIAKHIFKAAMTRSAAHPPAQAVLF